MGRLQFSSMCEQVGFKDRFTMQFGFKCVLIWIVPKIS